MDLNDLFFGSGVLKARIESIDSSRYAERWYRKAVGSLDLMQAKEQRDTSYEVIMHETFLVDVRWKSCYDNLISKLCHWIIFENYLLERESTSK